MSFVIGTATDYIDLLKQMKQIATGNGTTGISSIAGGGTGYTAGDILTVSGGTFSHVAKIEVLTVSGGVITAARISQGGAYTSNPSNPVSVTGGTGTGGTFNLTFASNGWTIQRESKESLSAVVSAGGTGYAVGNIIELNGSGSLGLTTASRFAVATLSGSAVATVTLNLAGLYEVPPTNPSSTTAITGSGTGCTLTVTYQVPTAQDQVVILQGTGSGSDTILVGVRTFNTLSIDLSNTSRNWSMIGFTGYNAGLTFDNQPGISPGSPVGAAGGAYVILKPSDAFNIDFWISATPRRIRGNCKCSGSTTNHYMSWYIGWMNQFGTQTEFPYPILIAGCSARHDAFHSHVQDGRITGLTEMIGLNSKTGPAYYRRNNSVWQEIKNSSAADTGSPSRGLSSDYTCYPCGEGDDAGPPIDDRIVANSDMDWQQIIPNTGVPGTAQNLLKATPDSGGDKHFLVPATILATHQTQNEFEISGELDGVFWCSAANGEASQDRILVGNDRYRIFQNGSRIQVFSFMAVKED